MLARSGLVVAGLGVYAQLPQFAVQVLHVGRDACAQCAEVVVLELLALRAPGTYEGASGVDKVLSSGVFLSSTSPEKEQYAVGMHSVSSLMKA